MFNTVLSSIVIESVADSSNLASRFGDVKEFLISVAVLWGVSMLLGLTKLAINYLKTVSKSARLDLALEFAEQAVIIAERTNQAGSVKKEYATSLMRKRLNDNGIDKFFTVEQIDEIVEKAVAVMDEFDFERNVKEKNANG